MKKNLTYFRNNSVRLASVVGSLLRIGLGAVTFAIRLRNGPKGAVHSSSIILKQKKT